MATLSVFNLNIMHGRNRRSPVFPLRLSQQEIQSNLQKITDCIQKYNPDIITLQEIDESSVMSGSFNQFNFINEKLKYPYQYFAPSCSIILFGKKIFVSGNAIFSKYPLENCQSFNFDFSFPTERQGFVIADIKLPQGQLLTITSIHLVWIDWTRSNSRLYQLELIRRVIATKNNNIVIAGDMNCDLLGKEKSLRTFISQVGLKAYEPESKNLPTSPSWNPDKRIDYVLPSKNINFVNYRTINDRISDHLATFAILSV